MKKLLFGLAALLSISGGTTVIRQETKPGVTEVTELLSVKTDSILSSSLKLQAAANQLEKSTD